MKLIPGLILLLFLLTIVALDVKGNDKKPEGVEAKDTVYSFPNLYNPNPIGGRLYTQAIGIHDDQVVEELEVDLTYMSASEHGEFFRPADDNAINISNENVYMIQLSKGFVIHGAKFEAGAIVRTHQDLKETNLSIFLAKFHHMIGQDYNIPDPNAYYGAVGENKTVVIGSDGQFYITNAEVYFKMQLLKEDHELTPNMALKFTLRAPLSDLPFDTFGGAVTLGMSKQVGKKFIFQSAIAISYQGLDAASFNSKNDNLSINDLIYDIYAGFTWDVGAKNGFYVSFGDRITKSRMNYKNNNATGDSNIFQLKIGYLSQDGTWEVYVGAQEDLLRPFHQLEPDFSVLAGLQLRLK